MAARNVRLTNLLVATLIGLAGSGSALAIFPNGGFEQGDFSSWTIGGGSNQGLLGATPFTSASISITPGGPGPTALIGTLTDPNAPTLVLPRLGSVTAQLNNAAGGSLVTTLKQVDTVTSADVDSSDGLPHIRFSFAPVLEDPNHTPNEQPYFYVALRRVSDNSLLFEQFAYSGQAGVNFLTAPTGWKYLPFQDVDVSLPANAVGEQIELTVIAADCSLSGHGGYVYVDGFGSQALPPAGGGQGSGVPQEVPSLSPLGLLGLIAGVLGLTAILRRKAA
ncbi:hypothetical protein C7S18_09910 [Ahniella affigens]|uniref:PEP-CTERM sorting domain-containing protein n=1 Tax=Ahniella affigens TaxID=2021234 RepID=A0A2P1PRM2_9GAMM|nr:hypothetical protein [Ahniella affigens]AVP97490.1 hypothetical protein C7S18_09910 [Ahniella affigens]